MPCVIALLFLFMIGPAAAATLTGKADIVDGDTIKVGGIPVRLYGIDAPEGSADLSAGRQDLWLRQTSYSGACKPHRRTDSSMRDRWKG